MNEMDCTNREIEIDREFGKWLWKIRLRQQLTTCQLRRITGISDLRIKQLESGTLRKGVTRPECEAIAEAFGLSVTEVIRRAAGTMPDLPTESA